MRIEKTTDSFGNDLWKVAYFRDCKICYKTFYNEVAAIAFDKTSSKLKDVPFVKPKRDRRHEKTVPCW